MEWCDMWKTHVLGFYFDDHISGETYLTMLTYLLLPQVERLDEGLLEWFQKDGAPAHYAWW